MKKNNVVNADIVVELLKALGIDIPIPGSTVKGEPKVAAIDPKPLTIVLKGFKANGETKTGLRRFSPKTVTFKGDKARFFLGGNAVYVPKGARFSLDKTIEVTIKPEAVLNKDGSVKHSRGGHSFKTANTVVLDNGTKFFVDGYYEAK